VRAGGSGTGRLGGQLGAHQYAKRTTNKRPLASQMSEWTKSPEPVKNMGGQSAARDLSKARGCASRQPRLRCKRGCPRKLRVRCVCGRTAWRVCSSLLSGPASAGAGLLAAVDRGASHPLRPQPRRPARAAALAASRSSRSSRAEAGLWPRRGSRRERGRRAAVLEMLPPRRGTCWRQSQQLALWASRCDP
jgi:hypothetical protein